MVLEHGDKYMKPSKFNFELIHDSNLLIFNCKTCGFAKLDGETISQYRKLTRCSQYIQENSELSSLVKELSRGGFLVEDDENELETLRILEMISRYRTNAIDLTIAPTLDCNLNCIYCYEMKQKAPRMMNKEVAKKLIDFLDKKLVGTENLHVVWYGGEPLLAPKVIFNLSKSFTKLCDKHECSYFTTIVSNCYLLDKPLAEKLKEDCRIESVQVTIDGPQEVHDKRRPLRSGKGSFEKIVENLKEVCDIIKVVIRVNIDMRNIPYISQLLDFLSDEGFMRRCQLSFGRIHPYTDACKSVSGYCYTDEMYSKKEVELYKMALSKGFEVKKYPIPVQSYCGAVSLNSFIVDPEGNFYKCWGTLSDETEIVGSLDQPEFYSKKFFKWMSWNPFEFEECRKCNIFPICKGGCPYRGFKEGRTAHCLEWKYNLIEMLKLFYLSQLMHPEQWAERGALP